MGAESLRRGWEGEKPENSYWKFILIGLRGFLFTTKFMARPKGRNQNPKYEYRNPKQYRITKILMFKTKTQSLI